MRIAIYGNPKQIETLADLNVSSEIIFSTEDIESGRRLEREGKGTFFTCYMRMADAIGTEDVYLCLKEIAEQDVISLFSKGLYVIFANDFYYPAPIASYDNSYLFEIEKFSDAINKNKAGFNILSYYNDYEWAPVDIKTFKFDINKNSCKELSKNISRLLRFGYSYEELIDLMENPECALGLFFYPTKDNEVDMKALSKFLSNHNFEKRLKNSSDNYKDVHGNFQKHVEETAKITKEIIKYFKEN